MSDSSAASGDTSNFIRDMIDADLASGKVDKVITRFPPEPNGYLHIGHAKSICLNFGIARDFDGYCNLRFDDTNPEKEEQEYIDSIRRDVEWLGSTGRTTRSRRTLRSALRLGNRFDQGGKSLRRQPERRRNPRQSRHADRGRRRRPYRERGVEENLRLTDDMKNDRLPMANCCARKSTWPHRTSTCATRCSTASCVPPSQYRRRLGHLPAVRFHPWTVGCDEGVLHSLYTLEFEDHRPLYDWILDQLETPSRPEQTEFARLQLEFSLTSKRKLNSSSAKATSAAGTIRDADDFGHAPARIHARIDHQFCDMIGITKKNSTIEMGVLETALRDDLNARGRRMAVINPLKVVIEYPEERRFRRRQSPATGLGTRRVPFSREIYIERDDFWRMRHASFPPEPRSRGAPAFRLLHPARK